MKQIEALEVLKSGKNVFLTGEPGAGKTYTINLFTDWLRNENIPYAITASTGTAATHVGGTTIHSWSCIGVKTELDDNYIQGRMYDEAAYDRINDAKVLIVDEVSMLDANFINNLDYILCKFKGEGFLPFGGIQVVFVGDFFQLPPVTKDGDPVFAFESNAWKNAKLEYCYLTEQHRQNDPVFLDLLNAIRSGTITEAHKDVIRECTHSRKSKTHLFCLRRDVDRMNTEELAKIDAPEKSFRMSSSGSDKYAMMKLRRDCLSPEILVLKVGARVMFTRNNFEGGFVNGTIGTVVRFSSDTGAPVVETVDGQTVILTRAQWDVEERGVVVASVWQYPLRLAYAMTIHKAQGMSLDEATIDLSECFEYGQGYVAISRVRSLSGLHLEGLNAMAFKMHPKVIEQDKIFRLSTDGIDGTVKTL